MKDTSIAGRITSSLARQPDPRLKDVHTEHCCIRHGCKYGHEFCTVTTAKKKQSYPCEICDEEISVDSEWAYLMNEMFEKGHTKGYNECNIESRSYEDRHLR